MHGGLVEKDSVAVCASPADSALRLIGNQKCMSRITDSAILAPETNKTSIATTPYLGVTWHNFRIA